VDKSAELTKVAEAMAADDITAELRGSANRIVAGAGNPDAEIIFIGEAPGAKEDLTGLPFVGASGKILDQLLAGIGMVRDDVFITSVVKYRPPANRDPTRLELSESLPYLRRQLEIIQPRLIVFLGRHAMNCFLPGLKIAECHGQLIRQDGYNFLPLYHPAAALYNGSLRQSLADDFNLIPAIIKRIHN